MSERNDRATSNKERRRREILAAAFQEFTEHGYARTSMAAIAKRARASKETLYAWFTNKAELFAALFASRIEGLNRRVEIAGHEDPSPANLLPVIAEDILRIALAIAPFAQAVGEASMAARLAGQVIADERRNFVDYILWCRDRGHVAFDDDPYEIVSLFVAMAQGEWTLRLATGQVAEVTEDMIATHARRVTALFLKALAPDRNPLLCCPER
jgi:AcrR family transcriptional regulator